MINAKRPSPEVVPRLPESTQRNRATSPARPGTKNDFAGEEQRQFTRPTGRSPEGVVTRITLPVFLASLARYKSQ
jgi:hypothetical protein